MKPQARKSFRRTLIYSAIGLILIVIYPTIVWFCIGSCTGKIGQIDNLAVITYQSKTQPTKNLVVNRFISTEHFYRPFYSSKKLEFYIIRPEFKSSILTVEIDGQKIKYEPNRLTKVSSFPEEIKIQENGNWNTYKMIKRDLRLLSNPAPSFWSQLSYGPTLSDMFGICD